MNRPLMGRIVSFIVVFYLLALAGFCAYVFITFSANDYLPGFRVEVTIKQGFTLFMRYLMPVHAAAVAVAASLAGTGTPARGRTDTAPAFGRIISSTLVVFLLLTAAYTFVAEVAAPRAAGRIADLQYISRVGRSYEAEANKALLAEDFGAALDAVDRYLSLDPGNKAIADQRPLIAEKAQHQKAPAQPAPRPLVDPADSAQSLFEKAKAAMETEDWFTAHYFAQAAAAADPRRRDAQQLAAAAWDELTGAIEKADKEKADQFRQKRDAYALLDSNPVAAYYAFLELSKRYPQDKDIATYAAQAAKNIEASTFFVDEARKLAPLPGTQSLLFFNRRTASVTEVVSIGKMVEADDGSAWFFDIEAVSYDAGGRVAWHFSAPYGKRLAGAGTGQSVVLMHAVDRAARGVLFEPVYLQGSRPAAERDTLLLAPTMEELHALSAGGTSLASVNIATLLRLRADLGALGIPRPALNVAMAMKMVMPFVYLTLSMLAVALGWGFRARPGRRLPLLGILMLPVIPVVCGVLTLLYVHAHQVVAGFTVLAFGLPTALVVLGALQLILLATGLVLLAGQSTR